MRRGRQHPRLRPGRLLPLSLLLLACAGPASAPQPESAPPPSDSDREHSGGPDSPDSGDTGALDFLLEWELRPVEGGLVALWSSLPAGLSDCLALDGAPCADEDADGLVDAWEDLVLEGLRPVVVLDEDEDALDDADRVLADIGRVAPAEAGRARVYIMVGWSRDYGRCGVSAHDGDSERVALDLALEGLEARVEGAYTAAHEGEITDHGRLFEGEDLGLLERTEEPRWRVYASEDKHASYGSAQLCEEAAWLPCLDEDCAPDGVDDPERYALLPPIWNAGEEAAPRLTELSVAGFPGEQAWVDQPFCGGRGQGGACSSPVREKLLVDPFSAR